MTEQLKQDYNEYLRLVRLHTALQEDIASIVNLHSRYLGQCNICMSCPKRVQDTWSKVKNYFESNKTSILQKINEADLFKEKVELLKADLSQIEALRGTKIWESDKITTLEKLYNLYCSNGKQIKIKGYYFKYLDELVKFYKKAVKDVESYISK